MSKSNSNNLTFANIITEDIAGMLVITLAARLAKRGDWIVIVITSTIFVSSCKQATAGKTYESNQYIANMHYGSLC